jgi:anti-sigma-K factor RskA
MKRLDNEELNRLAYAHATGTLDEEDRAWLAKIGPDNADFNQHLAAWHNKLAGLDLTAAETTAPASVWERIETEIKTDMQQQSISTPKFWWQTFAVAASITLFGLFMFWQAAPQINSVNLDNQWLVQVSQADQGSLQLTIAAQDPIAVPEGKVCNLWFKTGKTVIGIAQMPIQGNLVLDLEDNPQLRALLAQPGTMMVTIDAEDAGLAVMNNQSVLNGQWL